MKIKVKVKKISLLSFFSQGKKNNKNENKDEK